MTKERAKELVPIVAALADGKQVQFLGAMGKWEDSYSFPDPIFQYRVKPEPREGWGIFYPDSGTVGFYKTKDAALRGRDGIASLEIVHFREVIE